MTEPLVSPSILLLYVAVSRWMMLQHHYIINKLGYMPQQRNEVARFIWNMTFRKTYARRSTLQVRSGNCKNSAFWVKEEWVGDASADEVVLVKSPKVVVCNAGLGVGCFEWVHDKHVRNNSGKGKGRVKDIQVGKEAREIFFAKGCKPQKEWRHASIRVPQKYKSLKGHGFGTFVMDNVRGHLWDLLQEVDITVNECSPCVRSILEKPEFHRPFLLPHSFTWQAFRYHTQA